MQISYHNRDQHLYLLIVRFQIRSVWLARKWSAKITTCTYGIWVLQVDVTKSSVLNKPPTKESCVRQPLPSCSKNLRKRARRVRSCSYINPRVLPYWAEQKGLSTWLSNTCVKNEKKTNFIWWTLIDRLVHAKVVIAPQLYRQRDVSLVLEPSNLGAQTATPA